MAGVLVAAVVIAWTLGARSAPPPTTTFANPPAGGEGRVRSLLGTDVSLGPDRRALDAYRLALIASLTATPRATSEPTILRLLNETRVLVLELDGTQTRVRVLDGDNAGREGWVYSEVVIPLRSGNSP